jgi:hypothetical protein
MFTDQMQSFNTANISYIHFQSPSGKLNCLLFVHLERRKRKNLRHQSIEIVLRNVVKIKTQTMNLQSLVHFMQWHLLGQTCGKSYTILHSISTFVPRLSHILYRKFCNCLSCRLADAHKISIEKSKYLGGL